MNTNINPTVVALYQGGSFNKWSGQSWEDNQTFGLDTDTSFPNNSQAGDSVTLSITGAMDVNKPANNVMDGDPQTIAYADATGKWHGFEDAPDHYNVFQVATALPFVDFV